MRAAQPELPQPACVSADRHGRRGAEKNVVTWEATCSAVFKIPNWAYGYALDMTVRAIIEVVFSRRSAIQVSQACDEMMFTSCLPRHAGTQRAS
jgi:hypothetical protein